MGHQHYLRRNHQTLLPRRLVILDTETQPRRDGAVERHQLRVACATRDVLGVDGRPIGDPEQFTETDPRSLWWWVTHRERRSPRTFLYAHNVQFDLLASGAFVHLPALGWQLHRFSIGGRSDWFWWRRDQTSLICANSASWLPMKLDLVGRAVGRPKLAMPRKDASLDAWTAYCERDVQVLRSAMLRVIAWVADQDLGSWRYTPAAQGFAAWRHRFMRMRPQVHGQPETQQIERRAYHAGRCEAYRLGRLEPGPWIEVDYQNAYPRICAEAMVPAELITVAGPAGVDAYRARPPGTGIIADCSVTIDVPAVPARTDRGTCWPVGTFRSWLPGPEIDLALECGAQVDFHRMALYTTAPLLRDFARWILQQLEGPDPMTDPILRGVVKRWGQSFVGRLGARRRSWERIADDPENGVGVEYQGSTAGGGLERRARLAGAYWAEVDQGEGENAVTAIAAWVTSIARVRLWRALEAAGRHETAYVDTDGLIVTQRGLDRLQAAGMIDGADGLRVKRRIGQLEVWGPGAYQRDGRAVVKGLPAAARPLKAGGWSGELWQGVLESTEAGDVTHPMVSRHHWRKPHPEPRGRVAMVPALEWEPPSRNGRQSVLRGGHDRVVVPYTCRVAEGRTLVVATR